MGAHVVLYPLTSKSLINIVLCHDEEVWTSDGWSNTVQPSELIETFKRFVSLRSVLDKVTSVQKWGLLGYENKRDWHRESLALLGDSCHPMLPYLAQGANKRYRYNR